jgi:fatty-acyl-CoA synthase
MLTHRDMLARCATSYPSRIAITSETGVDLTYDGLERATNSIAHGLSEAGLGPGHRLVWLDRNSADYLLAYFATAKLGMTITPLNAWLRATELAPQIALIRPDVLVAGADFVALAEAAAEGLPPQLRLHLDRPDDPGRAASGWRPWRELQGDSTARPDIAVDENDVHEVVFTSGTTGEAKGVMRTQRARILDSAFSALGYELGRNDHLLWFLPQFHIGGGAVPNQLLIQGGRVTILRQFDPIEIASALKTGVTYIVGVPAHYNLLFESGALDHADTSGVRGCYVGGSVATNVLFQAIRDHFPTADLVHGYGSSESGPHSMALRGEDFLQHFGSLGQPVAGTEARVVNTSGVDAAVDEIGELWTRSDSTMTGYLDRPELTASVLTPDGWLRTGDLVRRAEDGFFYLVDRAKDIIITGGENVYPREIEDVIATYPGVAEVAVIGIPDPLYEERVLALVRFAAGTDRPDPKQIIDFVRARLAGFKTPKEVRYVEDFPRTGAGKIAKPALRSEFGSVFGEST